jgi:hypothetical protein
MEYTSAAMYRPPVSNFSLTSLISDYTVCDRRPAQGQCNGTQLFWIICLASATLVSIWRYVNSEVTMINQFEGVERPCVPNDIMTRLVWRPAILG